MVAVSYQRKEVNLLQQRLCEPPRLLLFIAGPRQVGKTTMVQQVLGQLPPEQSNFVPVDRPDDTSRTNMTASASESVDYSFGPRDTRWLVDKWQQARIAARQSESGHILVLDEIQKVAQWSETVKGLWDTDRAEGLNLHVILLGSSPLLMQRGMSESLMGRYELITLTHWSFTEMHGAFGFDLNDYIFFGGYPGAAAYVRDEPRWKNYVNGSLIAPSIEKDIFEMARVDKPSLLKQLFHLASAYSGQIVALSNMKGQLENAGNETTLADYLILLENAGLLVGMQKYYRSQIKQRKSPPKHNVLNNALMTATSAYSKTEALADRTYWGRVVESAVGQHLYNSGKHNDCHLHYWREGPNEVDFVIERGNRIAAIEVKSGTVPGHAKGLESFEKKFGTCQKHLVGDGGIPLAEFLSYPAEHWL
ncbi:MAG: AAA family ATPase [Zetaproteobacteria bacterium CG_4_9_14_3_um_filter_53_7]|nr:MAG: AAA family ATPase [Zetaproteobacteria bacterium CG_4_9_14_3_um_filter_53_7]